jgi:hypothetical protein
MRGLCTIALAKSKGCISSRDELAICFDQAVSNGKTSAHTQDTRLKFEPLSNLCRSEKIYAQVYRYASARRSLRARLRTCRLNGISHSIVGQSANEPTVHKTLTVAVRFPHP